MPHDKPTLADLERAVEETWAAYRVAGTPDSNLDAAETLMHHAVADYVSARRAAREAGNAVVVLSQKTVRALREWDEGRFTRLNGSLKRHLVELFIEDVLGTVLMEADRG
jgi:hypothetical protein